MTSKEFSIKVANFMERYISNGRTIDEALFKDLKELSDFSKNTEIYKTQKDKADFYDYSYDDVFNHMCYKIQGAPFLAVWCAILCIPFICEKYIQERGIEG